MLNVGVIGIGSMGQNHARVYSEIANLIGVSDANPKTTEKVSSRYNTKGFDDYHKLLASKNLDAVTIATPTETHFEVCMAAINAGKHVLVEKPFTSTIEDGEKLIKAAQEQNVVLAVGQIERHNPVVRFTKDMLNGNKFGNLISLSSRRVSSYPARIKDVGVIFDLGIHDIDVMRYLVGAKIKSIYTLAGMTHGEKNQELEDHANILLEFEGQNYNVPGFIEVNWLTPMKVRKVSLTCSQNFVEFDYITQSLEISSSTIIDTDTNNLYQLPQKYEIRRISIKPEEPLKNELLDFLNSVITSEPPLVSGVEGLETLKIAQAAVDSYKKGQRITMEE
ncbi:Gfo/Idh/MocA family protein [[Eubacterium] cellulosolvens]